MESRYSNDILRRPVRREVRALLTDWDLLASDYSVSILSTFILSSRLEASTLRTIQLST